MEFVKYQGIGNDYLVYDVIKNKEVLTREQIKKICDRNFGVGADGILAGPYLDEEKKLECVSLIQMEVKQSGLEMEFGFLQDI